MNSASNLKDRILWHDGSISLSPPEVIGYLLSGNSLNKKVFITDLEDTEIKKFNNLAEKKLEIKKSLDHINTEWNIPDKYKNLDIKEFMFEKLLEECERHGPDDKDDEKRALRTQEELRLFEQHGMNDLLKVLIYIVDTFKDNRVIWGTGRGSSCSSYLLYLIHLHDVDCIKYDLNINEFLR